MTKYGCLTRTSAYLAVFYFPAENTSQNREEWNTHGIVKLDKKAG